MSQIPGQVTQQIQASAINQFVPEQTPNRGAALRYFLIIMAETNPPLFIKSCCATRPGQIPGLGCCNISCNSFIAHQSIAIIMNCSSMTTGP